MATAAQAWVAVVGGLLTAILALMTYFSARSRREKVAVIGKAFSSTVDALSAPEKTKQLAAAVLLRRFFDPHAEQGASGQPYQREAVAVIAALLRNSPSADLQKLLADGLAYADSLAGVDLQHCDLNHAYWGPRPRPPVTNGALRMLSARAWPFAPARRAETALADKCVTLTDADLSYADLSAASLRRVKATGTVFRRGTAVRAVFTGADLRNANFKGANVQGADFKGAIVQDADFKGAIVQGADFTGCDLTNAQFQQAKLKDARFEGAQLHGASFEGAEDVPDGVNAPLAVSG